MNFSRKYIEAMKEYATADSKRRRELFLIMRAETLKQEESIKVSKRKSPPPIKFANLKGTPRKDDEGFIGDRSFSSNVLQATAPQSPPPPQTEFSSTWTLVELARYYESTAYITNILTIPGTDDAITVNGQVDATYGGLNRIEPSGGGTEVWFAQAHPQQWSFAFLRRSIATDETYVFVCYRYSTVYRIARYSVDDGILDWEVNPTSFGNLVISATDVWVFIDSRARKFDGYSATAPSLTSYTMRNSSSVNCSSTYASALTGDGSWLVTYGLNEDLNFYQLSGDPGGGTWDADYSVDMMVDPSAPWGSLGNIAFIANCAIDLDAVWIGEQGEKIVYKFDSSGVELASVDAETDLGLGSGTITGICTDKYGGLYVCIFSASPKASNVVKYDSDGILVTSTQAQDITIDTTNTLYDVSVTDQDGTIWISHDNGYTTEISVS